MTWLVAVYMYWSFFKEILEQSSPKSIRILSSLIIISDIGLLLGFCIIFILIYDPQSQKQILVRLLSILSTIETIFFLWVSPICPKRVCKISFFPFFKALTNISRANNGLISQFVLFINYTYSILDLVMIVLFLWCKFILRPWFYIYTPYSLSWLGENKFALDLGKPNTSLIIADNSKLSSFKHKSFIFSITLTVGWLTFDYLISIENFVKLLLITSFLKIRGLKYILSSCKDWDSLFWRSLLTIIIKLITSVEVRKNIIDTEYRYSLLKVSCEALIVWLSV